MKDKTLHAPIKYAMLFSGLSIALYLSGPYDYPKNNRPQLLVFLLAVNLCMYFGFLTGTKTRFVLSNRNRRIKDYSLSYPLSKIINILFWLSLVVALPQFIIFTKAYDLNIGALLRNITLFFSDAYGLYSARHQVGNATGIWQFINYFVVLVGPLYWAYTPLAMLFWKRLKSWRKILTIFIWGVYLLQYLCTGTNVGFFDFIITFVCVYSIKNVLRGSNARRRRKGGTIIIAIVGIILLFYIFDVVMGSRIGDQYLLGGGKGLYRYTFNDNSLIWRVAPKSMKAVISYITRYLCGGYNALALALNADFHSTFGVGYSWFLLDELKDFFPDLWNRTYNVQIDALFGLDYYSSWHTAYVWFANDVSFAGVPIVLYGLFYYFGRCWKKFIMEHDLISFFGFMLFVKFVYFVSANNQVFQNSNTLFAFWILVVLALFSRRYSFVVDDYEKI